MNKWLKKLSDTQKTELTKLTEVNTKIENTQKTELTKLTEVNTPQFRRWRLTIQQARDWEDL